jgi:hypothetical protein
VEKNSGIIGNMMNTSIENKPCIVALQVANIENGVCAGCQIHRNGAKDFEVREGAVIECRDGEVVGKINPEMLTAR